MQSIHFYAFNSTIGKFITNNGSNSQSFTVCAPLNGKFEYFLLLPLNWYCSHWMVSSRYKNAIELIRTTNIFGCLLGWAILKSNSHNAFIQMHTLVYLLGEHARIWKYYFFPACLLLIDPAQSNNFLPCSHYRAYSFCQFSLSSLLAKIFWASCSEAILFWGQDANFLGILIFLVPTSFSVSPAMLTFLGPSFPLFRKLASDSSDWQL